MSLTTTDDDTCSQCARCEGWRFATSLEDDICRACHREMDKLNLMVDTAEEMIPISVKMYYDHFKWHFEKEIRDKVRGTRLIFTPFSPEALLAFREYTLPCISPNPNRQREFVEGTGSFGAWWWRTLYTFPRR